MHICVYMHQMCILHIRLVHENINENVPTKVNICIINIIDVIILI